MDTCSKRSAYGTMAKAHGWDSRTGYFVTCASQRAANLHELTFACRDSTATNRHYHLGLAHANIGYYGKAIEWFSRAIEETKELEVILHLFAPVNSPQHSDHVNDR